MKHLSEFNSFIFENKNADLKETIEDCLLEFCDTYDLDSFVDFGYLVNGIYVPSKMLDEIKAQSKYDGVSISIIKTCRVQMYSKNYRDTVRRGTTTLLNKWDDKINADLKSCIDRIITMSNNVLYIDSYPTLLKTFLGITLYLNFPNVG
jgi:hypothetical protein